MPSPASKVSQSRAGTEDGKGCFYSREVQTRLWAAAHGAVKGGQSLSPPRHGCAGTASSRDTIPSAAFPFSWLRLIYSAWSINSARKKVLCQYSGHTLLLQGHCSTRSRAALLLQMLLCRQGGSERRINPVQPVVAESELEEIESNQEYCPRVFTTESLPFGRRAERRQQSQKWGKEKENQ